MTQNDQNRGKVGYEEDLQLSREEFRKVLKWGSWKEKKKGYHKATATWRDIVIEVERIDTADGGCFVVMSGDSWPCPFRIRSSQKGYWSRTLRADSNGNWTEV